MYSKTDGGSSHVREVPGPDGTVYIQRVTHTAGETVIPSEYRRMRSVYRFFHFRRIEVPHVYRLGRVAVQRIFQLELSNSSRDPGQSLRTRQRENETYRLMFVADFSVKFTGTIRRFSALFSTIFCFFFFTINYVRFTTHESSAPSFRTFFSLVRVIITDGRTLCRFVKIIDRRAFKLIARTRLGSSRQTSIRTFLRDIFRVFRRLQMHEKRKGAGTRNGYIFKR